VLPVLTRETARTPSTYSRRTTSQHSVLIWQEGQCAPTLHTCDDKAFATCKAVLVRESIPVRERDTLVVDTIGLNTRTFVDQFARRTRRSFTSSNAIV